jgi:monoamine oxidase
MNDSVPVPSSECDVVVVGAGAAGVAAGRRLVDAGLDVAVLEARDRLGGRAHTIETPAGYPVDVGCEWLHSAESNSWTGIAQQMGFAIDERLPNWSARVAWLFGEAAQQDYMAARDRFDARCEAAAGEPEDRAEIELLEPGGRWNGLMRATSTWANGTELEHVSVKDHARYENSGNNWRVLKGYGTLISAYGAGLPVRFGTVVSRIDHSGRRIVVATNHGDISARAVIVTVSTNLIARETIRFVPALPNKVAAAAGLPLGIANKMFFAISGPADDLPRDRHLIGATDRTATGGYQMRAHGWPIIGAYFGGMLAADLESRGAAAMAAFALDELAGLFGSDIRKRLTPVAQSSWVLDPFANGSYSCALPGHADDRLILAAPVDERLHFAGEACSVSFFGTAHAAFDTAMATADRVLATLGAMRAVPYFFGIGI